jgi:hypothetical protein
MTNIWFIVRERHSAAGGADPDKGESTMKKKIFLLMILSAFMAGGCSGYMRSNTLNQLFYGLLSSNAPVLNPLVISATDASSITLAQPTMLSYVNPVPTVQAYLGEDSLITITGSTVGGTIEEGPIDVSAGPYTFNGLAGNTSYRIIVVAQNSSGYSVQQTTRNTGGIAPVLNPLSISATNDTSITLDQPDFFTPGNPQAEGALPGGQQRWAYIGPTGGATPIAVDYVTGAVTGTITASVDVYTTTFPYAFSGLTPNTSYRIIVVAQNSSGLSIRTITQSTALAAPVMDPLSLDPLNPPTATTITLLQPNFSIPGNPVAEGPLPGGQQRWAYIGLTGGATPITVDYITGAVTGTILDSVDVYTATFPYTFGGLTTGTSYRIIVVAQNSSGLSIRTITQITP